MVKRPKLPNEFLNLVRPRANKYFRPSKGEEMEKVREKVTRRSTNVVNLKTKK